MDAASFRTALDMRGGGADIWLVFLTDPLADAQRAPMSLVVQRAFWSRGEAYAYAQRRHGERPWQHFSVYRLFAGTDAVDVVAWTAAFEMSFERAGAPMSVSVSPTEIAHALGDH